MNRLRFALRGVRFAYGAVRERVTVPAWGVVLATAAAVGAISAVIAVIGLAHARNRDTRGVKFTPTVSVETEDGAETEAEV